jgi:hypothetical protein
MHLRALCRIEYAFVAADHDNHSVAGVTVVLTPGMQSVVSMKFVGEVGTPAAVELQHTPMASNVQTSLDNYLDCTGISPAPVEGDEEQSGALQLSGVEPFASGNPQS